LKSDGTVVATGYNASGQTNVSGWTGITAVSAGGYHTVGLKSDGTVVAVGDGDYDKTDVSGWTGIRAVSAGGAHTVGLKSDGTVVATGYNASGQTNVSGWQLGSTYAPSSITIKTTATSARIGGAPILTGRVTPAGLIGKNMVVYVKKPGRRTWSYSSNRTMYSIGGNGAWYYKYTFKKGMTKGVYLFRATVPVMWGYATSTSPTISIRLR
jgi:hypothetical protein